MLKPMIEARYVVYVWQFGYGIPVGEHHEDLLGDDGRQRRVVETGRMSIIGVLAGLVEDLQMFTKPYLSGGWFRWLRWLWRLRWLRWLRRFRRLRWLRSSRQLRVTCGFPNKVQPDQLTEGSAR